MNFSRREFLGTAVSAPLFAQRTRTAARRPNVLVILTDDQGWGDLSVHDNTNLATPNIDSLARDGVLFERFFVCSVCAPTRAEFLTGRYHPRSGVRGVSTGQERMNTDERTIADAFRAAGYATGAFGKWHNGTQPPYHPKYRGFDEYYGFTEGHWGHYFSPEMDHNGKLTRGEGFIIDDLTNRAIRFIEGQGSKPFLCYLPLNTPHSPMQVPDKFYAKFADFQPKLTAADAKQEDLAMTRAALAMCENIDWNVGRVLSTLDRLKLAEDTIVFYFSDNGPNSWRWNGGMKGRKGSLDEGGLRVPALMRWTGRIRSGRRINRIAGAIDLLPTFADLAGVALQQSKPLDGQSLKPLLLGEGSGEWPDRTLFTMQNRRVGLRTQQYRLDPQDQLFDMDADPRQSRDIAAEKPEVAARLIAARDAWAKEMLPLVGDDDRPYPVGYSELTLLPARDGVPHGGVQRSNRAPNCSYFTHWTSADDSMTWDVEVTNAGSYEAAVYYTCAAADVGSTIELSLGGARVQTRVSEANDPPLVGAREDRASRGTESYVKDFKPLRMGRIRLEKTRGPLTLRALSVAGRQVADIRYVALTRVKA